VIVGRDISDRREREEVIQNRTEQLELINEQLQTANEKLAEGSRMKNEFLANTSHELRTPLNAVIGFATLLEQGVAQSEKEGRTFARSIRESAEHLLVVINDILDLAKVEAGKLEMALEREMRRRPSWRRWTRCAPRRPARGSGSPPIRPRTPWRCSSIRHASARCS